MSLPVPLSRLGLTAAAVVVCLSAGHGLHAQVPAPGPNPVASPAQNPVQSQPQFQNPGQVQLQQVEESRRTALVPRLGPTAHPPLPGHPSLYWLVPDLAMSRATAALPQDDPLSRFGRGVRLMANGDAAGALPLVSGNRLASTPLAAYADYYRGLALQRLGRLDEAAAALAAAKAHAADGYLKEAVPLQQADLALARGSAKDAEKILNDLKDEKVTTPEDVLLRHARAADIAGDVDRALRSYRRVYYEFPLSQQAIDAQSGLERLETADKIPADRFKEELARSEKLFAAKRWAQSRAGFQALARVANGNDRELLALRLAECDFYLDRARAARDALVPFLDDSSREAEARFFHLTATRAMGALDTYVTLARQLVADHPDSPWAEETLNNLATHYIMLDEDGAADLVFRELQRRFPGSRYSERAAWKAGWWSYKMGDFADTAQRFEAAAAQFPRADFRPAWLYWSGRARDRLGDTATANNRYRLTATDYLNSYYGRLASALLAGRGEPKVEPIVAPQPSAAVSTELPNDPLVRQLVSLSLYDEAMRELQYAQRAWGDSSAVQATIAWMRNQQGLDRSSPDRFVNLRGGITLMRRAYPQFLAAGGETLPPDVLRIIFPLDYWPIIKKYSDLHQLDPYLMAALIAQESTFTANVKSHANAVGLMQLIPAAGRQYARKLGLRYSPSLLTSPETNVRLGMQYFKDLSDRFGGPHFALASYNAGPHRVARWLSDNPDVARDEFIDDIPFPETQNYVKRILGTAEDYRRLYGEGGVLATTAVAPVAAAVDKAPSKAKPAARKRVAPKKPAVRPTRR